MSIHPPEPVRAKITLPKLLNMKANGERIAMLTCYDACFAQLLDASGVDILLVGDSLGMVLQGHGSTLPVELAHMVYHTQCVAKGTTSALVMADMPFGSYAQNPEQAYASAAKLMAAGAQMVKLEGGDWLLPTVAFLAQRDIPVCSHLGLMPQSVHATGGYRIQGKTNEAAKQLLETAQAMQNAGASMVLLELVPAAVAADIRTALSIPLIGIGAGPNCDGQVLVLHDMLHINLNKKPKFVRNFMDNQPSIQAAVQAYVNAVKTGTFPGPEHTYNVPA